LWTACEVLIYLTPDLVGGRNGNREGPGERIPTFRVDSKRGGVDGLVALDDIAILVHEDEIRDADLREVLGEGIQPEVVCEDRVSHGDVSCDALVESAVCEAVGGFSRGFSLRAGWKANSRKAAARCCLRYNLSSSRVSNVG
jgi:hypothetical protein